LLFLHCAEDLDVDGRLVVR